VVALWKRVWWPLVLLALAPAFYVWSIHSSGTPITVPHLWPYGWYNTRYALAVLPLAAFAAGALVAVLPSRARLPAALILSAIPASVWSATRVAPITWKESEVNSVSRRMWTGEAAEFLAANYLPGSGMIAPFGDLTGVLREAGIPLREGLHEGNGPAWLAALARPDVLLREEWGLAFADDDACMALRRANYRLRKRIIVKGARMVEIYQRP
jgi:hypothetical protein